MGDLRKFEWKDEKKMFEISILEQLILKNPEKNN